MPKRAAASGSSGDAGPSNVKKIKIKSKTSAHQLADPLPDGEVLTDMFKKQWRIGPPVGSGGFGLLYLASPDITCKVGLNAPYVVKCEPHSNGPLFCELHFYQRVAKPDMISAWKEQCELKSLGVPQYISSGSHDRNDSKYRFMIMERFGTDLQKLFVSCGRKFPRKTVLMLAVRLLDTLEYIHSKEYVHADIKASNLLCGFAKGTTDQVFLVDYGLAFRYSSDGRHKEYKEDPRKAHDGTVEFTSRDAHKGVTPSRRGDLEILGYCLLQWLCGTLPWEKNLDSKEWVKNQKIEYMSNISGLMKACFPSGGAPDEIVEYLKYVEKLKYADKPDYQKLHAIFQTALRKLGYKDDGKFDFTGNTKATKRKSHPISPIHPRKKPTKSAKKLSPSKNAKRSPAKGRKKSKSAENASSPVVNGSPRRRALKVPSKVWGPKTGTKTASEGNVASQRANLKRKTITKVASTEISTQTSPGLKGLPRSRKPKF